MRRFALPLLSLSPALGGCCNGPRAYTYDLDIRNAAHRPVRMEVLRLDGTAIDRLETELISAEHFTGRFTTIGYDRAYLEVRLRAADGSDIGPMAIFNVDRRLGRYDILIEDDRLIFEPRRPAHKPPQG